MKIGFSSLCSPTWDLRTLFEQAVGLGASGLELRGLEGQLHLPHHPELARNSAAVVDVCRKTGVELACLGTSASLGFKDRHAVADQKAIVREHIELAQQLHCPFVRLFTGDIPPGSNRYETLGRAAEALADVAHFAGRQRVTVLIENSGDLASSKDLWFLLDAVSHPALQACWNLVNGRSAGDHSTVAIPRLGSRLAMVHVADADFEGALVKSYTPLGEGDMDLGQLVDLLTGIAYDDFLMIEWPKLWDPSLAEPQAFLPPAVAFLKELLNQERTPLTAYKGDKNAPKFGERTPRIPAPR